MQRKEIIPALKEIIIKAGYMALDLRSKKLIIEYKSDLSPVSNADKALSDYISDNLKSLTPYIPIICEEREIIDIKNEKYFWLVDPIDGTKSFIKNKDSFTVNIALIENAKPVIGLIYQPILEKLYFTDIKGDFVIEISGKYTIPSAHKHKDYVAVVSSHHMNLATKNYLNQYQFDEIISIASSIKLAMVAEGAADIYPKFGSLMEWDIAAGDALIRASGGVVKSIEGAELLYGKADFKNNSFLAIGKRSKEILK